MSLFCYFKMHTSKHETHKQEIRNNTEETCGVVYLKNSITHKLLT